MDFKKQFALAALAVVFIALFFIMNRKADLPMGKYSAFSCDYPNLTLAYVDLHYADAAEHKSFTFMFSPISSTIHSGSYEVQGNELILYSDYADNTFHFLIKGKSLIFQEEKSSELPKFKDTNIVSDGTVFTLNTP